MPRRVYLCAGLITVVAAGYHWAAFSIGRSHQPTPLAAPLDQLPIQLGEWTGADVPLPENVVRVAATDAWLNREYANKDGDRVTLYIAYYGNVKDRVPHGPTVCYPYQGWQERLNEMVALPSDVPDFPELRVRKLLYEKNLRRDVVLYWYAANGKQQIGSTTQKLDSALRDAIGLGGAYVFQVMVTASARQEPAPAFARLERFLSRSFPAIARHFPDASAERALPSPNRSGPEDASGTGPR